jgi:hypothetical protein
VLELESDFSPCIDSAEDGFELADTEGISRTAAALGSKFPRKEKKSMEKNFLA